MGVVIRTDSRRNERRRRRRRRGGVLRWLWRGLLLVLLWPIGVALYILLVGKRDEAAPADAIVVLGAAAYDAKPSPVFEQRIRHGIALHRRGLAPILIFTGGFGGDGARFAESQVAERYALRQGVAADAMLIETVSRNTRENLAQAQALMRTHGLTRAIVVSDPLHMSRALRICRTLELSCLGSPTPTTRYRSFDTRWRFLLNEIYYFHGDLLPTRQPPDTGASP